MQKELIQKSIKDMENKKFTSELMWKALKVFFEREGIICGSSRSCIREFFNAKSKVRYESVIINPESENPLDIFT